MIIGQGTADISRPVNHDNTSADAMVATQELKHDASSITQSRRAAGVRGRMGTAVAMYRSLGIAPARSPNRHPRYSCTWEKLAELCLSRAADVADLRF